MKTVITGLSNLVINFRNIEGFDPMPQPMTPSAFELANGPLTLFTKGTGKRGADFPNPNYNQRHNGVKLKLQR